MNTERDYPDWRVGRYWKYLASKIYFGDDIDPVDAIKVFEDEFVTDITSLRFNGMLPKEVKTQ